jgi:hypothetical protein
LLADVVCLGTEAAAALLGTSTCGTSSAVVLVVRALLLAEPLRLEAVAAGSEPAAGLTAAFQKANHQCYLWQPDLSNGQ